MAGGTLSSLCRNNGFARPLRTKKSQRDTTGKTQTFLPTAITTNISGGEIGVLRAKVISMRRAIVDSTFTFHQKRKLLLSALDSITALRRGVGFDFFDSWLTICNTPNQLKPGSHMTTATSRIPPRLASGWGCRGPRLSSCSSLLV